MNMAVYANDFSSVLLLYLSYRSCGGGGNEGGGRLRETYVFFYGRHFVFTQIYVSGISKLYIIILPY